MVYQWHRNPRGLLLLLLQLLKNLLLRQLLKRTFSIFLEVNRLHKQVFKMDLVLWTKSLLNKMDLVLWTKSLLNKMDLVLWTKSLLNKMDLVLWNRSKLNKILLLSWINQLIIQIWIKQVHSVDQAYLITWTCRLNQLQLYLLAMEEETCSQDCLCQTNKQYNRNFSSKSNLNNLCSNNNLNNLISNNNNHQPKNHLYGMTISLANFLISLVHLWINQQVRINLLSPIFFQSYNQ